MSREEMVFAVKAIVAEAASHELRVLFLHMDVLDYCGRSVTVDYEHTAASREHFDVTDDD